jgi:hypothetical protein
MMYIPSFIKIGPVIQKLVGGEGGEDIRIAWAYFYRFKIRNVA